MSIYLELAEEILRDTKEPMTAMQMLRVMYARELAPWHLRGRTQHKTLQARLSEDILKLREKSRFFRTEPGKFFLREFLNDASVPEKFRREIVARRRTRDLPAVRPLTTTKKAIANVFPRGMRSANPRKFLKNMQEESFGYIASGREFSQAEVAIWTASLVIRHASILTYRVGKYREDRDNFLEKRSIGFFTPVVEQDATLFDRDYFGIIESAKRALSVDLDLHEGEQIKAVSEHLKLQHFMYTEGVREIPVVLGVISFRCPDEFYISSSRLAINDLEWMDLSRPPNDIDDFDPWSQAMLCEARRIAYEAV